MLGHPRLTFKTIVNNNKVEPKTEENEEIVEIEDDFFEFPKGRRYKQRLTNVKLRPGPIEGIKDEVGECVIKAAKFHPLTWLFVSRLTLELTPDQIKQYVKENAAVDCECEKLTIRKNRYFSSFKLGVPAENRDQILNAEFWPKGVTVNAFLNLRRIISQRS